VLPLNSANGAFSANAIENARLTLAVQVLSSISGGNSQLGKTNALSETGLFNLTIPTGPMFSAYGIRFTDNVSTRNGDGQLLQLFVRFNDTTGQAEVAYILQDFHANTITLLGKVTLAPPAGANQILFEIDRPIDSDPATNDPFVGKFAYVTNGAVGSFTTLGQGMLFDGFQPVDWVRGQFFVAQAVPEPNAAALVLIGVGLLATARMWRRRNVSEKPSI
jgi:PEP-CTERM motif-containing protein